MPSSSVCVVDRERPRRADLVLAAVALADRGRVVVLGRHHLAQLLVQRPRLARRGPRPCRSAAARRPSPARGADGAAARVRGSLGDDLLVVGVDEERERGAVGAGGRLDHVRDVALLVADPLELRARVLGVGGQVEVAAVRDPLELRPADREEVLEVARAARVVRELVGVVRADAQVALAQAEVEVPAAPLGDPVLVPLLRARPAGRRTPSPSARTRACGRGSCRA